MMMTRLIYSSKWDPIWREVLSSVRAGWLANAPVERQFYM